jgi:hypothetical protein
MRLFNTIPGQFVGAVVGGRGHSEEWDKKKYIPRFWECSGSQPPKWSVCHRHLSPGWQNVILFYFFIIPAWERKELLSRSAASISRRSFFFKRVNRITERDLELKQLRLKFFEIKLIYAINGISHLRFR